jgi:hypothetical protein
MEDEVDYWEVSEGLRARGHKAWVEGGGAAGPWVTVGITRDRTTLWEGDRDGWFGSIVEADGSPGNEEGLAIISVTSTSSVDEVADAISEFVKDL